MSRFFVIHDFSNARKDVAELTDGEVVAIDGKRLRRSFDRSSGKAAIHMVSAWATLIE